jgi:aminoglycoside phosphotransferase family enzyme
VEEFVDSNACARKFLNHYDKNVKTYEEKAVGLARFFLVAQESIRAQMEQYYLSEYEQDSRPRLNPLYPDILIDSERSTHKCF